MQEYMLAEGRHAPLYFSGQRLYLRKPDGQSFYVNPRYKPYHAYTMRTPCTCRALATHMPCTCHAHATARPIIQHLSLPRIAHASAMRPCIAHAQAELAPRRARHGGRALPRLHVFDADARHARAPLRLCGAPRQPLLFPFPMPRSPVPRPSPLPAPLPPHRHVPCRRCQPLALPLPFAPSGAGTPLVHHRGSTAARPLQT